MTRNLTILVYLCSIPTPRTILIVCVCAGWGGGGVVVVVMAPRFRGCFGVRGLFRGPLVDLGCHWVVIELSLAVSGLRVWARGGWAGAARSGSP